MYLYVASIIMAANWHYCTLLINSTSLKTYQIVCVKWIHIYIYIWQIYRKTGTCTCKGDWKCILCNICAPGDIVERSWYNQINFKLMKLCNCALTNQLFDSSGLKTTRCRWNMLCSPINTILQMFTVQALIN